MCSSTIDLLVVLPTQGYEKLQGQVNVGELAVALLCVVLLRSTRSTDYQRLRGTSDQESWFQTATPVLIFTLSRQETKNVVSKPSVPWGSR